MAPVEILQATTAHAERLALSLSEESRRGLDALRVDPLTGIMDSLRISAIARTMLINGDVAMVIGVAPKAWGGQLWFLTSDVVLREPRAFLRAARTVFAEVGKGYSVLANIAHAENERTLRLARHFGFAITEGGEVNGHPFVLIRWEATNVHGS